MAIPIRRIAGSAVLHAADLDGDRDLYILAAGVDGIGLYENTGGGMVGTRRQIAVAGYDTSLIRAADFDGDGDADIL